MAQKWKICLSCGAVCFPQDAKVCLKCQGTDTEKEEVTIEDIIYISRAIRLWGLDSRIKITLWFKHWKDVPEILIKTFYTREKA
jgi:hypothetical protein